MISGTNIISVHQTRVPGSSLEASPLDSSRLGSYGVEFGLKGYPMRPSGFFFTPVGAAYLFNLPRLLPVGLALHDGSVGLTFALQSAASEGQLYLIHLGYFARVRPKSITFRVSHSRASIECVVALLRGLSPELCEFNYSWG